MDPTKTNLLEVQVLATLGRDVGVATGLAEIRAATGELIDSGHNGVLNNVAELYTFPARLAIVSEHGIL